MQRIAGGRPRVVRHRVDLHPRPLPAPQNPELSKTRGFGRVAPGGLQRSRRRNFNSAPAASQPTVYNLYNYVLFLTVFLRIS